MYSKKRKKGGGRKGATVQRTRNVPATAEAEGRRPLEEERAERATIQPSESYTFCGCWQQSHKAQLGSHV